MIKNIYFIILFLPLFTFGQLNTNDEIFLTDDWSEGLHIFIGIGLNHSTYRSNTRKNNLGIGANFKTDVGWYLHHDWAIESSASVRFNSYEQDLIWDTLLTLGVRYRYEDYYYRGFAGAGVLVVVLGENKPHLDKSARRLHMDGPAIGIGMGHTMHTKNGKVWFIEFTATAQEIKHRDEVAIDGQYPVAISSQAVNDNSTIYSTQFNIGVLLF